jgi:hypothetical protein
VVVVVVGIHVEKVKFSNVIACYIERGGRRGHRSFGALERAATVPSALPFYLTATIALPPLQPSARNVFLFG